MKVKSSSVTEQHDNLVKEEDEETATFETILSKVGFGSYQVSVFVVVGVIGMCDAGESQALSLVLPILEKEWGISNFDESLMGSLVYVGYLIGSLLSGAIGDKYGRRHSIVIASGVMFLFGLAGAFMPNFIWYTIFRILLVTCVGFIIPIAFSALAESTPLAQRGFVLVCIGIFYTMGELTVCGLVYIFMPSLDSGNWRAVLVWSCVPAAISFVIAQFFLFESPRYLLINGRTEQARDTMIKIGRRNNSPFDISKIQLVEYTIISQQLQNQMVLEQGEGDDSQSNFFSETKKLLKNGYTRITLIVWYQWMASSLVFAGITFLLPLTLKKIHPDQTDDNNTDDLKVITLSVLGELPTLLIATVIVNIRILGRKRSLAFAYLACGILSMLIYFLQQYENLFQYAVSGAKLSINLAFTINYEFTSELYPTYMRASGIGMASAVGKIGSIVMPWLVVYISNIGAFTPYLIFGGVSALGSLLTLLLPFDTFARALDEPCR